MGMILVTGQPGHGKTAWAIDYCFQLKKEGREIYASGIKDFDYDKAGFHFLEDATKWEELPDGSVILLDECYTAFPNRNPGAKVPAHVEALARHRHRGFDFVLVAQQGLQLDPFLRGLYEQHIHVRQTSIIKSKTKLKRWNQYQSNVNGLSNDVVDWIRPSYVFDYYTSTTKITTKRHMPMWLRWLLVGVLAFVAILLGLKWYFMGRIAEQSHGSTLNDAALPGGVLTRPGDAAEQGKSWATATAYAKDHLPRFPTMPWTAPIYDGRAVVSQPRLFCMSSSRGKNADGSVTDGSCSCITEQGSRYDVSEAECRTVAYRGEAYNPYRQEVQQSAVASSFGPVPSSARVPVAVPASASASTPGQTADTQQAAYGAMRGG